MVAVTVALQPYGQDIQCYTALALVVMFLAFQLKLKPYATLNINIIFSVAKYLHLELKSYTLRPDAFTLNFNVTLSGTSASSSTTSNATR